MKRLCSAPLNIVRRSRPIVCPRDVPWRTKDPRWLRKPDSAPKDSNLHECRRVSSRRSTTSARVSEARELSRLFSWRRTWRRRISAPTSSARCAVRIASRTRPVMLPLSATAPSALPAASARMVRASLLLARGQRFFLLRCDQAFHFHPPLFTNLVGLLPLLLRRQRRVRADAFDLRAGLALDGPALLHHRFLDPCLLPARLPVSAAPRPRLRWRRGCRGTLRQR